MTARDDLAHITPRLMTRAEARRYCKGVDPYHVTPPLVFGRVKRWDRLRLDEVMEDPPGAPKRWPGGGRTVADLKDATEWLRPTRAGETFVYFIQSESTGLIKIGRALNVLSRFTQLQTGSADILRLLGCMQAPPDLELELHAQFAAWRRHGEWFEPAKPLLRYIEAHARAT